MTKDEHLRLVTFRSKFEKPQPGHRVQMDVKFLERIPGTKKRLYQFTAIDDCTRIRVLKIYDKCNQTASVDFANEVIRRLPFRVLVVQTDNGSEFGSRFHWHLEKLDIRHVRIRPRTPRLNGKVERSHRIDNGEFYRLLDKEGVSDDIHLANKKVREWENYYNHNRPHGGLGGQTPFERFLERTRKLSRTSVLRTLERAFYRPRGGAVDFWPAATDPMAARSARPEGPQRPTLERTPRFGSFCAFWGSPPRARAQGAGCDPQRERSAALAHRSRRPR